MLVETKGFAELEQALGGLEKELTRRAVARRALKQAADPMRAEIEALAPEDEGVLKSAIAVGTRANFGRRKSKAQREQFGDVVEVFIGIDPAKETAQDKVVAYSIFVERGTSDTPAQPYFRPGWERDKLQALERIKAFLGPEIEKAAARQRKR